MRKLFLVLLILGVSALLAAPASAVMVKDLTTNTVLFYDGFENLGANVSHAAYPDNSGDYDPTGGAPGSWNINEPAAGTAVQVTDYAAPGAYHGDNYLRVVGTEGYCHVMPMFTTPNIEGEVIEFSQMVNIPAFTSGNVTVFDVEETGWYTKFTANAMADGSVQTYLGSGQYYTTDVTWTADTWQDWTVTYVQGQSTATLTIDGVGGPDNLAVIYPNYLTYECSFNYMTPNGHVMYLDAVGVPEPSSIVLLVMGALALIAIRRFR